MPQEIMKLARGGDGDPAHRGTRPRHRGPAWKEIHTPSPRLVVAGAFVLLTLFALPAWAQGTATLKVAARVISNQPGREALAAALHPALASRPLLAEISRRLVADSLTAQSTLRRPRLVLTIAFLRN